AATLVTTLDDGGRTREIARMLGGDSDSETSLAHARELLEKGSETAEALGAARSDTERPAGRGSGGRGGGRSRGRTAVRAVGRGPNAGACRDAGRRSRQCDLARPCSGASREGQRNSGSTGGGEIRH